MLRSIGKKDKYPQKLPDLGFGNPGIGGKLGQGWKRPRGEKTRGEETRGEETRGEETGGKSPGGNYQSRVRAWDAISKADKTPAYLY